MFSTIGLLFLTSFAFIFLKALQQLNVVNKMYLWVTPTSLCMAVAEVYIIQSVSDKTLWLCIPIGLGGGLGCIVAMWFDTWRKNKNGVQ